MSSEPLATRADIVGAYRLLLGREPDAEGLQFHMDRLARQRLTVSALTEQFMASDEYRARNAIDADLVPVDLGGYFVYAWRGDHLIGREVIEQHSYEPHVTRLFDKALKPGAYVLDVGANIGIYALRAASIVGDAGRVIAVEPLPQNHQALYAGIIKNKFSNIEVLPIAASNKSGLITAICAIDSSNGIVGVRAESGAQLVVPTHKLDELLAVLPRLDVVKIDIEGHEPLAWQGMEQILRQHRPQIFSEFSPIAMRNVGQSALEYLDMLFAHAEQLTILHRDIEAVICRNSASVMAEWKMANQRIGMDGELHLDIYLQ